jgi:hypothetical protein
MEIQLLRTFPSKESTLGCLYVDHKPECFTLEDEYREVKVKGETRIPSGTYEVKFNESLTPLTEKYRDKYHWFTYHLEIQNVRNFKNVYIHVGNTDSNTDGCVLLGDSLINNQVKVGNVQDGFLGNSGQAFERFYKKVSEHLRQEGCVQIQIIDYTL